MTSTLRRSKALLLTCAIGFSAVGSAQELPGYVITRDIPGVSIPVQMTFVPTLDEIYTPIGLMKPEGDGPFPAVVLASGNGRGGMTTVLRAIEAIGPFMEELVDAGYVVAYAQYRNEVPGAYNTQARAENMADVQGSGTRTLKSASALDSDDFIAIIEYLKRLPYVAPDGVGAIGSSHGGELIMKAAAQINFGAGILGEPANSEFLSLDYSNLPPGEPQLQDKEDVRRIANKAEAMERIRRIDTPLLFMGRESDHLQGIFALTHEWLVEAGKNSTWASFDHPRHGYVLRRRDDDPAHAHIQADAMRVMLEFLDRHLKPAQRLTEVQ